MVPGNGKLKKRGFVMTGGGAKGLYEAGVMNAFHLTGLEFDIITGSSIGAMNSIAYAEYLYHKRRLPAETLADPERAIEAMDSFIKAFHYAWLRMEHLNIIDDRPGSPVASLVDDLARFNLDLPMLARLGWWYTTPEGQARAWPLRDIVRLIAEVAERVGAGGALQVLRKARAGMSFPEAFLSTYLEQRGLKTAIIPPGSPAENLIWETFTRNERVLSPEHLELDYVPADNEPGPRVQLLDPERTLGDYEAAGIEVRLTRANFRTGRLENSAAYTPEDFIAFLETHAWRWQSAAQESPSLGSQRLQVPGNPNAIRAALASGRFPGVFAPYPISSIYDLDRPDNALLKRILTHWLDDEQVEASLTEAHQRLHPEEPRLKWQKSYSSWRASKRLRGFFPRLEDRYVDGGAIDNTPSNTAVDAIREWVERSQLSKREVVLDLYVILLHPEPMVPMLDDPEPPLYRTVGRTLEIQGAAKLSSDAATVGTINTFGQRGEDMGKALQAALRSVREVVDQPQAPGVKEELEQRLQAAIRPLGLTNLQDETAQGLLQRLEVWAEWMVSRRLPLHIEAVKLYPDRMALSTLQFTRRFGYRKENAIDMLTMGCYNALWSLRSYFEENKSKLDEKDKQSWRLARKWMGVERWPEDFEELERLKESWPCQRMACPFHAGHCRHGAKRKP